MPDSSPNGLIARSRRWCLAGGTTELFDSARTYWFGSQVRRGTQWRSTRNKRGYQSFHPVFLFEFRSLWRRAIRRRNIRSTGRSSNGLTARPPSSQRINNLGTFAATLADFLLALQRVDPSEGPTAGAHSAYRGAPLKVYNSETLGALETLQDRVDTRKALAVWETALVAPFAGSPVWFHGDVAADNLLVAQGVLSAVIDFGCCGVGDPACDLVIAWTLFHGASRDVFRTSVDADEAAWARGRGWALWKALITLAGEVDSSSVEAAKAHNVIDEILAESGF